MDYCGPQALPHSQFLSWDPEDQEKALAWELRRRSQCGTCGTNPMDWVDSDGRELDIQPFVAESVRCYGCGALEDARAEVPENRTNEYHVFLRPNRERE